MPDKKQEWFRSTPACLPACQLGLCAAAVESELFGKMCFKPPMLHLGSGTAPPGVFQRPRSHLWITSGTSSQATEVSVLAQW